MTEKLNCGPGDLAVVVRGKLGQQGLVLKCERLLQDGDIVDGVRFGVTGDGPPIWIVDRVLRVQRKDGLEVSLMVCLDNCLRPIRDQPGDDEALTWAGLPGKARVTA